ncbi:MAG: hypothetical protein SOZ02_05415 [Hallerella porci]|uniref:Uncharacterized protein n=1 Tax=Hallerella porci TaxID=1945871 RepID=A0ABX5LPA3_9BACT|nr:MULTISPECIES: hypothetical protein [Hallerella]MCI5600957.1 hypothetical protein [Hallerella sp.]MDY3921588.1 hypothetical protein [Hallerella porci]PWK99204.1 hypothetical protein B0H50_11353 [Hallerella porci]
MRYDDKIKVCRRTAIWIAILSLIDVICIETGMIPQETGDRALTVFIVLLAISLGIHFYLKNKNK